MTKQEFMAFSLPYGLKVKFESGGIAGYNATTYFYDKFNNENLPICRPPSDITKEIEHNGEMFVPIDYLWFNIIGTDNDCFSKEQFYELIESNYVRLYPHCIVEQLLKWHFNLMDENEPFIDINTLTENPYK